MGESVAEATITSWLKEIGDQIEMDEAVLEIATDKVDTEVPCEFEGVLIEKCFEVDEIVQVGQTIAIIEVEGKVSSQAISNNNEDLVSEKEDLEIVLPPTFELKEDSENQIKFSDSDRFYSPLVKNIIKKEGIDFNELEKVKGSGKDNRINKNDILKYIESKSRSNNIELTPVKVIKPSNIQTNSNTLNNSNDEVVEMSRMG